MITALTNFASADSEYAVADPSGQAPPQPALTGRSLPPSLSLSVSRLGPTCGNNQGALTSNFLIAVSRVYSLSTYLHWKFNIDFYL